MNIQFTIHHHLKQFKSDINVSYEQPVKNVQIS